MKIYKLVITGGPCAGKTTALKIIKKHLSEKGFNVFTINETATELIDGNITPENMGIQTMQKLIFRLQLEKEDIFSLAAEKLSGDTVILIDRGLLDGNAYIDNILFTEIANSNGLSAEQIMSRYDAVFHLSSAAVGAEEFYTLNNNSARTENTQEAKYLDMKISEIWGTHPKYFLIKSTTEFEDKIKNLTKAIDNIFH